MKKIFFYAMMMGLIQGVTAQDAQQDHDNMMRQLGITGLRRGPSGDANAPNHAEL